MGWEWWLGWYKGQSGEGVVDMGKEEKWRRSGEGEGGKLVDRGKDEVGRRSEDGGGRECFQKFINYMVFWKNS